MAGLTKQDSGLLQWDTNKTSMQVKLGEFVQYFQLSVVKESSTPNAYIDPTRIIPYILDAESPDDLSDEIIADAKVPIDYDEGLPTVEGIPLWERLEGEPVPYYKLFKEYREMKYLASPDGKGHFSRAIAKLSESTDMTGRQLNALSRVYHWKLRVQAYDKFKELERAMNRQREIELLEEKHAKVSNKLLDQAVDFLLEHPEQLSPKVAIDLAQLAMKGGRLALGLNPDKPGSSASSSARGTQVNIVNQNANSGDSVNQMTMGLSPVEQQTQENAKDVNHLQSILHVLNQSGAFDNAVMTDEEREQAIEASFTPAEE